MFDECMETEMALVALFWGGESIKSNPYFKLPKPRKLGAHFTYQFFPLVTHTQSDHL